MQKITTTKFNLFNAFMNGLPFAYGGGKDPGKLIINSIERESGSNRTYNITGIETWTREKVTFFVCCID